MEIGKRDTFYARYIGNKRGDYALFRNIYNSAGEFVRDHMWLPSNKFRKMALTKYDMVRFSAKCRKYGRGRNKKLELTNIRNVKIVKT